MGQIANGKAVGPDNIRVELFKHGEDTVLERMHRICVTLWETGEWPEDWMGSTFVTIPKKETPQNALLYCIVLYCIEVFI